MKEKNVTFKQSESRSSGKSIEVSLEAWQKEVLYMEILERFYIDIVKENNQHRDWSFSTSLDVSMVDNLGDIIHQTQESFNKILGFGKNHLVKNEQPEQTLKISIVDKNRELEILKQK